LQTAANLQLALARNFGGTDQIGMIYQEYFGDVLRAFNSSRVYTANDILVDQLIAENISDSNARHLMLIGKSQSIVNIMVYLLHGKNMDPEVIFGSQFPEDAEGDYSYSVLSRIMVCDISHWHYMFTCVFICSALGNYRCVLKLESP
jgi:hypothetical protein